MITETLSNLYETIVNDLPGNFKILPPLFILGIIIALYSIFVWFFYRLLARKDVLKLNLAQYNVYKHSGIIKFFRVLFYIVEFMLITPIAIFFWFAVLSFFLIVLAKEVEVGTVILICAALISAIRITAYFNEDLSKDLAKMVPFTLLGVIILTPNFLNIETTIQRFTQIPLFLDTAFYYLLFIIGLEVILRIFYLPFNILGSIKTEEDKVEEKAVNKKI